MFQGSSVDAPARLSDVNGVRMAGAMELVNSFALAWRWASFVSRAENVLEGATGLME